MPVTPGSQNPPSVNPLAQPSTRDLNSNYGIYIRSWATTDSTQSTGITSILDAMFYGSSYGHVSMELKLPVNPYTQHLLNTYCQDLQDGQYLIPHKKKLFTNPDGTQTEYYYIYFSWWEMQSRNPSKHIIVEDHKESRKLLREAGYSSSPTSEEANHYVQGDIGGRFVHKSPYLQIINKDRIHPTYKHYFELKQRKAELKDYFHRLDSLSFQINQSLEHNKPLKINHSIRLGLSHCLGSTALNNIDSNGYININRLREISHQLSDLDKEFSEIFNSLSEEKNNEKTKIFDTYGITLDFHRHIKEKHIAYGRAADHEVKLPLLAREYGSVIGSQLGFNVEKMLSKMRRLRLTQAYNLMKMNCCITTRMILTESANTETLNQIARSIPRHAIDNPQIILNMARNLELYINSNGRRLPETSPQLQQTCFGLLAQNAMRFMEKPSAGAAASTILMAPAAAAAAVMTDLSRPTLAIGQNTQLLRHITRSDTKPAASTIMVPLLLARSALAAGPAAIERMFKKSP